VARWAVVIGIDKYWREQFSLRGAVRDALEMRKWLLDPAGGNVPERNLRLVLEPDRVAPERGLSFLDGRHNTIVSAIDDILVRSDGQGERFFFYFAGHGLTGKVKHSHHSAMLAADFTELLSTNSLTVASIFELFQGTRFAEQYFFIDACRNMPFETEKRLGEYPNPRDPIPPVSPQFVMYATQPGVKALEIRDPGNENGAFTAALRDGLRGHGSAKRWDDSSGQYVVRWRSLFDYVESRVKALRLKASSEPAGPLIQEPRDFGERNSLDPELARLGEDTVSTEQLQVDLDPAMLRNAARVVIGELAAVSFQQGPPVNDLPVTVRLQPRTYGVSAAAPGYTMRQRVVTVDLYQPKRVTVELVPGAPPPAAPPFPPHSPSGGGGPAAVMRIPFGERAVASAPAKPTAIHVSCEDALAQLELVKASGRLVQSGRGHLYGFDLPAGFYRARVISPEGLTSEKLVQLLDNSGEVSVTLDVPTPTSKGMQWAIGAGEFEVKEHGTVEPSESVKPSAFLKLSTVLALAAGAELEGPNAPYGHKLRRLGIPAFSVTGSSNGFMLLLGDEALDPRSWRDAEFRLRPQKSDKPPQGGKVDAYLKAPGIAYAAIPAAPGSYWFSLRLTGGEVTRLSTVVLDGRVTLLVLTRETDGNLELHQYQPLVGDAPFNPLPYEELKKRDPFFGDSRFASLRRIELMQRSVMHGRVSPTLPDIDMLLYDKWLDPIAGCLGGYLLNRMGRARDLEVPAGNLVKYFGALPDAFVLQAIYLEATDDRRGAEKAYVEALQRGVPIYRDGITLLRTAVRAYKIGHPAAKELAALVSEVPAGSLWSATPGTPS
jgi:hypothetical protein